MAIFELLDYIVNEVIYKLKNLHFTAVNSEGILECGVSAV